MLAVALADDDLACLGGHAEKGRDPHPDQGPGAAADNGRRDATDVAGSYCVGQSRAGCAETGNGSFALALGANLAEGVFEIKNNFPLVAEGETDTQNDTNTYQEHRHPGPPEEVVDHIQKISKSSHTSFPLLFYYCAIIARAAPPLRKASLAATTCSTWEATVVQQPPVASAPAFM